jgi:hypothetical protein
MKIKPLPIACCILLNCYAININAQNANRTLSNLSSPTAVNQSLIPGTNNTINLGSGGRGGLNWNNLYLGHALYLDGDKTLHAPGKTNFFVGTNAGNSLPTGNYNTGVGQFSLFSLTSGSWNTANGYQALYNNNNGSDNTANGSQALFSHIDGDGNTAIGTAALYSNTSGENNTAVGYGSLSHNPTGFGNTALGAVSLYNHNGSGNTAVGSFADVSTNNLTNATAIGSYAIVDESNKVRIGNTTVTSIEGQVGWTTPSDGRYKKDIKENVQGLAFINSLRPITYTVNVQRLNEYYNKGGKELSNNEFSDKEDGAVNAEIKKGEDEASKIVYNGFIAQEVETAAKKLNFEFSGVDKPQNKDGLYGLRYDNFVVPLVKAVQELSQKNDLLNLKISEFENLKIENEELKARIQKIERRIGVNSDLKASSPVVLNDASLEQNIPNPFFNNTSVKYILPSKFTTAQIIITDKSGKQLKQLNISGSGNGVVNIDASALSPGAYNYSLIVDGRIISSKQMIVGK